MEYITYRIGDIAKLSAGGDCPAVCSDNKSIETPIPIYSNGIDNEGLYGYTDKARIEGDTITVSARGVNIGTVFYRPEPYLPIVRLIAVVPDRNIVDAKYLYYYFQGIEIGGTGSAQPQIPVPFFSRKKICIHRKIEQQKAIARALSVFDELIECNNKRIKILEQMAENLYKEWFVRFRFPGHEDVELKDSRIGKIPQSFNVVKMKNVFEYYIGGGWGNDDEDKDFSQGAYVIRGTDFPYVMRGDLSTCPYRYHKKSNYKARKMEDGDIIIEVSGGTAEQPVGRAVLVDDDIIERLDNTVICASFCKLVRLNKQVIRPEYFYYWMKFLYDTRIIDRFQLQSTGIINFKFEYFLNKGDVLLPSATLMNEFSNHIKDIRNEINNLARQNSNLIRQRDILLPRLMSGKLQVK